MSELRTRSLHDLRGIAQSFGITDIFEKDSIQLAQAIELKQQAMAKPPIALPLMPEYDARLMKKIPAKKSSPLEIAQLLTPHIELGLKVTFDEEHWYMAHGLKTDTGTLRMPLRAVWQCAERMMRDNRK